MVRGEPAEHDSTQHEHLVKVASQQKQIHELNKKVATCPTHSLNCAND
jgi:hypothetical protein